MNMKDLKETLDEQYNVSVTENGALGYRTSGTNLVDINFAVTSMRNQSEGEILNKFVKAFYEDKLLAVKWLFFVRDAREGVGERRLFRVCMKYLAENHQDIARAVLGLIPEYGRFDDWLCLLDTDLADCVVEQMQMQLQRDMENMAAGNSVSLLAKWMPSVNASSQETKAKAKFLVKKFGMTEKEYRKMLAALREYLKVVEVSMSKREWGEIEYSSVSSRANLLYNNAFLKNDETRRRAFLASLEKGETKINASVLFPHDIVTKYRLAKSGDDQTLEALWKALPDFVKGAGNTLCIADGSGSMMTSVGGTKTTALDVANALTIYFAERCTGEFKDTYITFSMNPQIVDLSSGKTLKQKLAIAYAHSEVANTNIEAVFDLILQTAIRKDMKQEDLPSTLLILSDMEFDSCVSKNVKKSKSTPLYWWMANLIERPTQKLFDTFKERYEGNGYKLPKLVFWNICSRTGTIPVKENDLGVALVSGFSPAIVKMVLSNKTDPFAILLEQLNDERYDAVEAVLKDVVF